MITDSIQPNPNPFNAKLAEAAKSDPSRRISLIGVHL